ncbi:hypothetical protein V6N12_069786 [Hibiscus sabdariffa]|uniref:Uncharacterized protein n=1 Tax=Hibiscus sabdariffa TaxID=183260 RepID=A0ABR2FEW1_9ROSI
MDLVHWDVSSEIAPALGSPVLVGALASPTLYWQDYELSMMVYAPHVNLVLNYYSSCPSQSINTIRHLGFGLETNRPADTLAKCIPPSQLELLHDCIMIKF